MSASFTAERGRINGVGVGLRAQHFSYFIENRPAIAWLEVLTDNYLNEGGIALQKLQRISEHYPIALHGVGLSLGSTDALDQAYLQKLKALAKDLQPVIISEHLSWVSVKGQHVHQLLPLPYTQETVEHIVPRIIQTQDFLQQQILIENVSSYLEYRCSEMPEWEFLATIAERADCNILLDLNNIYVSATNQNYDALRYLQALPTARIKQFHLAGYEQHDNYLLDTHNAQISDQVWTLYQAALQRFGTVPSLIEWDANLPDFPQLYHEVKKAEQLMLQVKSLTNV